MFNVQSAETPCDVILGLLLGRVFKNLRGAISFDQLTEIKEGRAIRTTCCLLHIVRDNDNGEFNFNS